MSVFERLHDPAMGFDQVDRIAVAAPRWVINFRTDPGFMFLFQPEVLKFLGLSE